MMPVFAAPDTPLALADLLVGATPPRFIAGGTDLLISPDHLQDAELIVDLGRLTALRQLERQGDMLVIGAGITVARLARDPLVRRLAPALADAADQFGSVQIRNRATIGGNVANASAAADLAPSLVAMAAQAELVSPDGATRQAVADLLATRPVLAARTAIMSFRLPLTDEVGVGAFVKLGRRQEPTISRLTLAAAGVPGAFRLVAGAIGACPRLLPDAEAALNANVADFAEALVAEVAAAIPGRASAIYKARAIRALGCDLLARLGHRVGAEA